MGDQSFARLIKKRRDSLGFSQARLGELVGRSATTIRNWERGATTPSERSDAVALAAVLGLDETEVLERAGFEADGSEDHPTIEQAYASLAPESVVIPVTGLDVGDDVEEPAGWGDVLEEPAPPPLMPPAAFEPEPRRGVDSAAGPDPVVVEKPEPDLARAAPPTVLETTYPGEPSYLEDQEERQRYRVRAVATAAMVVFLFIVLLWSIDRATEALATMWDEFVGMLEL